jgi:hypothetical protein
MGIPGRASRSFQSWASIISLHGCSTSSGALAARAQQKEEEEKKKEKKNEVQ